MEKIRFICSVKSAEGRDVIESLFDMMQMELGVKKGQLKVSGLDGKGDDNLRELLPANFKENAYQFVFTYKFQNYCFFAEKVLFNNKLSVECAIHLLASDEFLKNGNSFFYKFKKTLCEKLNDMFEKVYWLEDTQNAKIAGFLYEQIQQLERFQKSIVEEYMLKKYGPNWCDNYDFTQLFNQYKKFAMWFKNSSYCVFEEVDYHLTNWQSDDLFELLKALKSKRDEKVSLWEFEVFDKIFDEELTTKWKSDFVYRKKLIDHNKIITRKMYKDTLAAVEYFNKKLIESDELLRDRINSLAKEVNNQVTEEAITSTQFSGSATLAKTVKEIGSTINETEDFKEFRKLANKISWLNEDAKIIREDLKLVELNEEKFFKADGFDCKLYSMYIKFYSKEPQYPNWLEAVNNVNREVFAVVLEQLQKGIESITNRMNVVTDFYKTCNLDDVTGGLLVQFANHMGEKFEVNTSDWFDSNGDQEQSVSVNLLKQDEVIQTGDIQYTIMNYQLKVNLGGLNIRLSEIVKEMDEYISNIKYSVKEILAI